MKKRPPGGIELVLGVELEVEIVADVEVPVTGQ